MSDQPVDQLYKIRHSLAHLLAAAVTSLYPTAKPTLGPPVDNGFYYDFADVEIGTDQLGDIGQKMLELLPTWHDFAAKVMTPQEALDYFADNPFKQELINEIAAKGEDLTFYTSGDFTDLCRGGHVTDMAKEITADMFMLDKVAGAYWRGDETRPMLTRIYGLAFETKQQLDDYQDMREQAKARDHRKLGKELDLFTFSDLVGAGLPLFTPKGTIMREAIVNKIHNIQAGFGYQRVSIPHITKKDLYETSGHWEKFGDELFHVKGKSNTEFVMKPMNCPHHTQIYASQPRSYKDLPIRYTEATMVYRDEQAGELLGLGRVRSITQDDGHVFCAPSQIAAEIESIISVIKQFYGALGMWSDDNNYWVSLSVRDPQAPEKYLGDPKLWDDAEQILHDVATAQNLKFKRVEGEAAFYGPKLDFMFYDALGRERQLATAQLDFNMPNRFKLEYIDADGEKKTPVMIHRAIAGSLERFMSIAIEHFAGAFPLWLSPIQLTILPVSPDNHGQYAQSVYEQLTKAGLRVTVDAANDSLGKRIRKAKTDKTPYLIIVGDKEAGNNTVTAEGRGDVTHKDVTVEHLIETLQAEL